MADNTELIADIWQCISYTIPDDYKYAQKDLKVEVEDMVDEAVSLLIFSRVFLREPLDEYEAEVSFWIPESWWQMFKEQYAPKWFKSRFPVMRRKVEKVVTVKCGAVYPKLPYSVKEVENDVRFAYTHSAEHKDTTNQE